MSTKQLIQTKGIDFRECWQIAYSLFLSLPHCVIREITVCRPLKMKQSKHKHNITIQANKKERKQEIKAQQNTTNTWSWFECKQNNKRTEHAYSLFSIPFWIAVCYPLKWIKQNTFRECWKIAYSLSRMLAYSYSLFLTLPSAKNVFKVRYTTHNT